MTRNEAAERLRSYVGIPGFAEPHVDQLIDAALAAERRATVEPYLREVQRLCRNCTSPELAGTRHGYSCDQHRRLYLTVIRSDAILDEEAAR